MSESFNGSKEDGVQRILQRLRQQSRSNMPSMTAQRAMSTFNLHAEPPPPHSNALVNVVVYPQNPFVGEPEVRQMLAADIQPGLINRRVQISDSRNVVTQPDENGNYLYWRGTPEFDQVNAFYYVTFTLRMYERYAHREIAWAFPSARITVDPYIGDEANAFYNEQEHLLGFHSFKTRTGERQSTARSADIVTHEAAHAVLDGIRDLYNESFGLGPRALHESFGDITAMLVGLHDDQLVHRLLDVTDGNLRTTNFITEVAEHLAKESHEHRTSHHTIYLRNAFNKLEMRSFDQLSYAVGKEMTDLSRQEHNYSRLLTGAIYDVLVGIYETHKDNAIAPLLALHKARDVIGHLLVMALELGPVGEFDFGDVAKALITAENVLHNGKYRSILREVFATRKLLSTEQADAHLTALQNLPDLQLPSTMNHWLAASRFLEEAVLPALDIEPVDELMPLAAYRNAAGYAYLTYWSTQMMTTEVMNSNGREPLGVDVFGGLTLMFDADNRLRSAVYRPINAEDIRQLEIIVQELVTHKRVAYELLPPHTIATPEPEGLLLPTDTTTAPTTRLVKYPAIFDTIPLEMLDLEAYLQRWQRD